MENIVLKDAHNFDLSKCDKDIKFVLESGKESNLFLEHFLNGNNIEIEVKDNSAHLSIVYLESDSDIKISMNLGENASVIAYFADFSVGKNNVNVDINLNGIRSRAEWRLASVSKNVDNKKISVSVMHNAKETFGKVENYGVSKDESKLLFSGTSHIIKGSIKSKTSQNARIMVFDEISNAIAKPILKIDENDIEANHAAVVGKISDEHLFYLTSRGISVDDAKNLITLGYLKPILKGFSEDKISYLDKLIGGQL